MDHLKALTFVGIAALLAIGQILFKLAARTLPENAFSTIGSALSAARNGYLVSGLALYAFTTVFWVLSLRDTDLSRAYPFMALAYVFVPLASVFVLGERTTPVLWLGYAFVIAGVLIVAWGGA